MRSTNHHFEAITMKTDITHTILVAVSKEATKRGYFTQIMWNDGEWSLYIHRRGDDIHINRNTKISVIERWMEES